MNGKTSEQVEDRLWAEIDKGRFGMLGLLGSHQHFQPMTAFTEKPQGLIWFFTHRGSNLTRRVAATPDDGGQEAMFIVQARDQDLQACIGGTLHHDHDLDRIERYWSPMVEAWYPEGRDDPELTLLRLDCRDAQVWLTEAGPMKYAWEVARSNMHGQRPDLSEVRHLDLN